MRNVPQPVRFAVRRLLGRLGSYLQRYALLEFVITHFRGHARELDPVAAPMDQRRRQRRSKREAKRFRRLIDGIFDEFTVLSLRHRRSRRILRRLPPIDPEHCEAFKGKLYEISSLNQLLYVHPAGPTETRIKNLNSCFLGNIVDDDNPKVKLSGEWYCARYQSVGLRALRGVRLPMVLPYVVRSTLVSLHKGRLYDPTFLMLSPDGLDWRRLEQDGRFVRDKEVASSLRVAMTRQLTESAAWAMLIERDGLKLRIQTDAVGIRELLILRDVDVGRRRAAIRHWVRNHDRKLPTGRVVPVKAHLRGHTDFRWRSWGVTVVPSQHDLSHLSGEGLPSVDLLSILDSNVDGWMTRPDHVGVLEEGVQ